MPQLPLAARVQLQASQRAAESARIQFVDQCALAVRCLGLDPDVPGLHLDLNTGEVRVPGSEVNGRVAEVVA